MKKTALEKSKAEEIGEKIGKALRKKAGKLLEGAAKKVGEKIRGKLPTKAREILDSKAPKARNSNRAASGNTGRPRGTRGGELSSHAAAMGHAGRGTTHKLSEPQRRAAAKRLAEARKLRHRQ